MKQLDIILSSGSKTNSLAFLELDRRHRQLAFVSSQQKQGFPCGEQGASLKTVAIVISVPHLATSPLPSPIANLRDALTQIPPHSRISRFNAPSPTRGEGEGFPLGYGFSVALQLIFTDVDAEACGILEKSTFRAVRFGSALPIRGRVSPLSSADRL